MSTKDKVIGRIILEDTIDSHEPIRSAKRQKNGIVKMEVVLQDVERINRNKRLYRKKAIEEAIQSEFIQEKLRTNSLFGEMNHPDVDPSNPGRQLKIDLKNVSHVVKSLYWNPSDPNELLGIVETTGNQVGRDVAALIMDNGMQCSFSMRGTGEVIDRGSYREVAGPIKLLGWDLVHFPSHKKAYVKKYLSEHSEIAITEQFVVDSIAQRSENTQALQEFVETTDNLIGYKYQEGKLILTEASTGKPLGIANLEQKLNEEYQTFFYNILAKR